MYPIAKLGNRWLVALHHCFHTMHPFFGILTVETIRQISSAMLVVTRSQFNTLPSKPFNYSTDLSNWARCELNPVTSFITPSGCRFNSLVACSDPWRELSTFALSASATWRYSKAAAVGCSKVDCISALFESNRDLWSCTSLFTSFNNCPNASTGAVKADPSTCTPRAWSSSLRERAWMTWQISEIAETASKLKFWR